MIFRVNIKGDPSEWNGELDKLDSLQVLDPVDLMVMRFLKLCDGDNLVEHCNEKVGSDVINYWLINTENTDCVRGHWSTPLANWEDEKAIQWDLLLTDCVVKLYRDNKINSVLK